MINQNYGYCIDNDLKLARFLGMDKEYIKDFYNTSYSKLIQALESALKRLDNKMLIHWNEVITIALRQELLDENGVVIGYEEVHQIAKDDIINLIIHIEKETATQMGFKNRREVRIYNKYGEFNTIAIKRIKEEIGEDILYYYRSYKINFNEFVVEEQKELELLLGINERIRVKEELNSTLVENYKVSNQKRYDNNLENKKYLGEAKYKSQRIKVTNSFVKNNNKLVDTLIDTKTYITPTKIHNTYIK